MYITYIIQSEKTDQFYIGQTCNLEYRLQKHNSEKVFSTKNRGPWKLIYKKKFDTRAAAMKHEKELKKIKNKRYLLELIEKEYLMA